MFTKPNIPVYLDMIQPAVGKDKEGDERQDIELTFRIHPISPELAAELDKAVRNMLWKQGNVEASEKVKSVSFDLTVSPQAILFRAAPDASRAHIEIPYARCSDFKARKHKDVAGWAMTFKAKAPTPGEHELALLHAGYTKQHFLTFEQAAPDLIDAMEEEPEAPAAARKGKKVEEEGPSDVTH